MRPLVSLLLFAAISSAGTKPVIVALTLGDKDPKLIADPLATRMADLKACGYDIIEKTVRSAKDLAVTDKKLTPALVWVSGHGGILESGRPLPPDEVPAIPRPVVAGKEGFHLLGSRDGDVIMDGEALRKGLLENFHEPQVYLQTCYSGACPRDRRLGLGCSSCGNKLTYGFDVTPEHLVKLLCSGVGDCVEWFKADHDADGVVTPDELRRYLARQIGTKTEEVLVEKTDLETVRRECDGHRGIFSAEEKTAGSFTVDHEFQRRGGPKMREKETIDGRTFLRRLGFPDSPKGRSLLGRRTVDLPFDDSVLQTKNISRTLELPAAKEVVEAWLKQYEKEIPAFSVTMAARPAFLVKCVFPDRPFREHKEHDTIESPQIESLRLTSPTCLRQARPAMPRKSGLQYRESLDFRAH